AATSVEQLGVDHGTHGLVDAVAAHVLEQLERTVARELELAEGRHVDDADPLAHGPVLDRDAIVVRRPRPAEPTLVLACPAPRLARPEVVGALPAVLRPEHGAELLQ